MEPERNATIDWHWGDARLACGATWMGSGPRALLLPALSSISTRTEMRPLQAALSGRCETVAVDWPGFGDLPRPRLDWRPEILAAWLGHVLDEIAPAFVIAAGHAAGYLVRVLAQRAALPEAVVLVAPTWRGPLPTMIGRRPPWLGRVPGAVDLPVIGSALYALNLNDLVIGRMARGHVYSAPGWLTPARMTEKRSAARAPGARFASVRFVTGALDPFEDSAGFRAAAAGLRDRLLLIWGAETPKKSLAEMEGLAREIKCEPVVLPHGKLGIHEEEASAVAEAVSAFLEKERPTSTSGAVDRGCPPTTL